MIANKCCGSCRNRLIHPYYPTLCKLYKQDICKDNNFSIYDPLNPIKSKHEKIIDDIIEHVTYHIEKDKILYLFQFMDFINKSKEKHND